MPNAWVTHVKKFAANNNVSYSCAISMPECKQSYKKEPTPLDDIPNVTPNLNRFAAWSPFVDTIPLCSLILVCSYRFIFYYT